MNMNFCYACGRQETNLVHTSTSALCVGCYGRETWVSVANVLPRASLFDDLTLA